MANSGKGVWKIFQEEYTVHTKSLKEETTGCLPSTRPV